MTGRFCEWVGVFLEKRAKNVSCGNISLAVIAKNKEQGKENMLRDLYIFCNLSCLGVSVNTAGHVWQVLAEGGTKKNFPHKLIDIPTMFILNWVRGVTFPGAGSFENVGYNPRVYNFVGNFISDQKTKQNKKHWYADFLEL